MEDPILAEFEIDGVFYERYGPAKARGESYVNLKLCFTATSIAPLARQMHRLSLRDDCFYVKLDRSLGRHGMARGRCFLTTREAVLTLWRELKNTDEMLCSVQDDDLTLAYR